MRLAQYLARNGIESAAFGAKLGLGYSKRMTLWRYLHGHRMPEHSMINRIEVLTNGEVTWRDFYEHLCEVEARDPERRPTTRKRSRRRDAASESTVEDGVKDLATVDGRAGVASKARAEAAEWPAAQCGREAA